MKKITIISVALLIILIVETHLNAAPLSAHESDDFMQDVVELTNIRRAEAGLPPLKLQTNLCDAGAWMAQDMAEHDYLQHTDQNGQQIDERLSGFGYDNFVKVGENIGAGQPTPEDLVSEWIESDSHRANMLNPNYREIGIGYFYQPDDQDNVQLADNTVGPFYHYWAQLFGSRADVYPVVINGEAARSTSFVVDLYIYGQEWATEMRLSNDGDTWSDWVTYQETMPWALADGEDGPRTVYVELRQDDTVVRSSDTIELQVGATGEDNPGDGTNLDAGADDNVDTGSSADSEPVDTSDPAAPEHKVYLPMVQQSTPAPLAEQDNTDDTEDTSSPDETETPLPGDTCLAPESAALAERINAYRAENGLDAIPVSISLSQVAQAHVLDLETHHPDTGACNQHSWSDQGEWSPVCYTDDHANAQGMWNKPRELTPYDGVGYEIAYAVPGQATADDALAMWQGHAAHNDVLLQRDMWQTHNWSAMGVAIRGGYAVAWFGDEVDAEGEITPCP